MHSIVFKWWISPYILWKWNYLAYKVKKIQVHNFSSVDFEKITGSHQFIHNLSSIQVWHECFLFILFPLFSLLLTKHCFFHYYFFLPKSYSGREGLKNTEARLHSPNAVSMGLIPGRERPHIPCDTARNKQETRRASVPEYIPLYLHLVRDDGNWDCKEWTALRAWQVWLRADSLLFHPYLESKYTVCLLVL